MQLSCQLLPTLKVGAGVGPGYKSQSAGASAGTHLEKGAGFRCRLDPKITHCPLPAPAPILPVLVTGRAPAIRGMVLNII